MSGAPQGTEPAAAWDLPRTGPSPRALSPAEWRARNDVSLARKVAIIVAAARDAAGEAAEDLPTNLADLREWYDPERSLWSWRGREVDDKRGRNKEVMARLHEAWRALSAAKDSRKAPRVQPGLRERLEVVSAQRDAAIAHVVALLRERNGRGPVPEEERH